jgi:hypothetical protein
MAFIYDLSDTWNAGGTIFTAIKMNVTDTASAAASRLIDLQVGGTTRFGVNKTGQVEFSVGAVGTPSLSPVSDTNTGMWFPAADTIAWSTAGSERVRISSAGNFGIGTSSPEQLLSIVSSAVFQPQVLLSATASNAFGPFWNSRKLRGASPASAADALGTFVFQSTDTGGTVRNAAILNTVSQGAGATWHSGYFVFQTFDTSGTGANRFEVKETGVAVPAGTVSLPSISTFGDPNTGIFFPAADTIAWSTAGSERLRITSTGNLGLGTSTFGTSAATVLAIATGTAPTTGPADTIQIYSTDLSAGNTMLSLYTEGTIVNTNTTAATTHRIAIRVNGTVYYLLANTAA